MTAEKLGLAVTACPVNLLSSRDWLLPTIAESVTADQGDWEPVTWLAIVKPT
jgi:hypothetical protein